MLFEVVVTVVPPGRHEVGLTAIRARQKTLPLARRRKEPFERLQQRVVAVTKAFEPYDWTKQL